MHSLRTSCTRTTLSRESLIKKASHESISFLGVTRPDNYFQIVHRIYHVWCMLIGLLMVVAIVVQVGLSIFEEFFSNSWIFASEKPGLALVASLFVSILILDVGTSLCGAAISLMVDAWHPEPFLAFRTLILFEPLHARLGISERRLDGRRTRADFAVLMLIYTWLDVMPILVAVLARDGSRWRIAVAVVCLGAVAVFWILDIIHDYFCKVVALRKLLSSTTEPFSVNQRISVAEPDAIQRVFLNGSSAQSEDPAVGEDDLEDDASPMWLGKLCKLCSFVRDQKSIGRCIFVVAVVALWILAAWLQELCLGVAAAVLSLLAILQVLLDIVHGSYNIVHGRCKKADSRRSLFRVKPKTEEDHAALCACIDDKFMVTTTCARDDWEIPKGTQLVTDGFLTSGDVRSQLSQYPPGCEFSFRVEALNEWSVFLETHCGACPVQVALSAYIVSSWCSLCIFVMMFLHYDRLIVASIVALVVYLTPVICLLVAPRLTAKFRVVVSMIITIMALLTGMFASSPSSPIFWLMPVLCLASHGLLHRRFQHTVVIAAAVALIASFVVAVFFSLSLAASNQKPFVAEKHVMAANFTFNTTGSRNPYVGGSSAPACTLGYPTSLPGYNLDLVDFGLFNKVVYEPDGALQEQLGAWMGDWKLVKQERREDRCKSHSDCSSADWASWFVFEGKTAGLQNTTVVTIRGTKSMLEILFDADLWSLDILGLKSFADHIPGVGYVVNGFWTDSNVGSLYYKWKRRRYAGVLKYVKHRVAMEPHRTFYLSGHSLGGGLAQLIAAEVSSYRVPAITISSPGVKQTAQLLGLDPELLQGLAVNVIPHGDPVPKGGGGQAGTDYEIPCLAGYGPNCHRVFNTVCELMHECGDRRHRVLPCDFCPLEATQLALTGAAPQCKNVGHPKHDLPIVRSGMPSDRSLIWAGDEQLPSGAALMFSVSV